MQCVILAGGRASRLRPLTQSVPKSLVPIKGHAFIHYQLTWLHRQGVTRIILCIGLMGDQIRQYVGDGSRWGMKVNFVDEGEDLLGTGGAIRLAFKQGVLAEKFLVIYGDSFLPINFRRVMNAFTSQPLPALMTVYRNEGRWNSSNVWYENNLVRIYDKYGQKPELAHRLDYIDYGLSAFSRTLVEDQFPERTKFDLSQFYFDLSQSQGLAGLEVPTRFYEIGSMEGIKDFTRWLERSDITTYRG